MRSIVVAWALVDPRRVLRVSSVPVFAAAFVLGCAWASPASFMWYGLWLAFGIWSAAELVAALFDGIRSAEAPRVRRPAFLLRIQGVR